MGWSKQAQTETLSFSPAFSSIGTIELPIEAPAAQPANTAPCPSITRRSDSLPKRDAAPSDDLRLDAFIEGSIFLNCKRLTIG
jgi:cytoskeletal protein CcmA (bactofilin family)